jgi:hypothetical protein
MELCEVVVIEPVPAVARTRARQGGPAGVPDTVIDLAEFERVRDAAIDAATAATDVRTTVHDFVEHHRDGRVLRRVRESLALDALRNPDDQVVRGAESLVAAAIVTLEPTSLTR